MIQKETDNMEEIDIDFLLQDIMIIKAESLKNRKIFNYAAYLEKQLMRVKNREAVLNLGISLRWLYMVKIDMEETFTKMEVLSKTLQLKLLKGEITWDSTDVQYFIPLVLFHTNFEWLRLIAENHLIEEDEEIVKNFLSFCESLKDVNKHQMEREAVKKMKRSLKWLLKCTF